MWRDVRVLLWKELFQFRKNLFSELGLLAVCLVVFGILPSFLLSRDPMARKIEPFTALFAIFLIAPTLTYMAQASEGTFSDEIREGALRMMLTTGIRPTALFVAKWLGLMIRAAALVAATLAGELIIMRVEAGSLARLDPKWLAFGVGASVLVSSYIAGANAAISLVVRTTMQLRQYGGLAWLLPLIALAGMVHFVGIGRAAMILVGALLVILTAASFAAAVLTFRSERAAAP